MKVLLTGATGLIGGEIAGRLVGLGHEVVAVSRRREGRRLLGTETISLDFRSAILADWLGYLADVDAVVNCVGVLQGNGSDSTEAAHALGPAVLFEACEAAGVRRVIHFSAVGVDRGARSSFSASKAAGDADLQTRDLDWVILRPSVVLSRPVYGASALFRGLATLPLLPRAQDAGLLQVVQLEDVVETVVRLLAEPKLNARDIGACRTGAAQLRRGRRALPPLVRLGARPALPDAGAAVPAALPAGRLGRLAWVASASAQQRAP